MHEYPLIAALIASSASRFGMQRHGRSVCSIAFRSSFTQFHVCARLQLLAGEHYLKNIQVLQVWQNVRTPHIERNVQDVR